MAVNIDVRNIISSGATEIYISAAPLKKASVEDQWGEIFAGIRKTLVSMEGHILQERIFGTEDAIKLSFKQRSAEYGDIDDGVQPIFLVCQGGLGGTVSGVQVHAIKCGDKPTVIDFQNDLCGRVVSIPGRTYLTLSGISAAHFDNPARQARAMFEKADAILKKYKADFFMVPRTWIFLGNILSWYDRFNQVRSNFFIKRGLITAKEGKILPASTGIGLSPYSKGNCAMDLIAVIEPANSIKYLPSAGRQHCAFEYGSAFSRATEAITPAAKTVFVSGTASIALDGRTTNIDDPLGQITETIQNIRAVLNQVNCADKDVVQAVAYSRTPEVEKIFNGVKLDLPRPFLSVVCDLCRPELLFEMEATAIVPTKR